MVQIHVTDREGRESTIDGKEGRSIMEVLRQAGHGELLALCGGCCSCATCHVYVDPAFADLTPPMSDIENDLLDGLSDRKPTSRLSCQIPCTTSVKGLKLTIAPEE